MTREEAIKHLSEWMDEKMWRCFGTIDREAIGMAIEALQADAVSREEYNELLRTKISFANATIPTSAEDIQQSEQYKKGFEDAKRAILVEYARESENMRKRIAQLEVMLNAQKAISAETVQGEWEFVDNEIFAGEYFCSICGKRAEVDLYGEWILSNFCPSCGAIMKGGAV